MKSVEGVQASVTKETSSRRRSESATRVSKSVGVDHVEESAVETSLGLVSPDVAPKVSTHIPEIVSLIEALVARGHAYKADNGDVYFAVETFPTYGKLSGKKLEDLRALWKSKGLPVD
jgi:cysteinyl-tRNA synthetase